MIQLYDLCLAFGSQPIFNHISCSIGQRQRIGLVGRNGSGKSTLLKAIIDPQVLDSGTVSIAHGKTIAYMPQEVVLASEQSIIEEALNAFTALRVLQKKAAALETALQQSNDLKMIQDYSEAQEQLATYDIPSLTAQAKKMLMGLGFHEEQFDTSVSTLSVGWRMRIVLAQLLLQDADFYLFDEPTNHLDLQAKEWFLGFLKKASFGFMIVCHERYFLDELCTDILELEFGNGTFYKGTYSTYEVQKEHNLALLESAYEQQQKEIKRKQETIERFRAKASKAKMAQSMIKSLDKIERITLPPAPKQVAVHFPPIDQPGKIVLTVHNVSQTFGTKKIFDHVSFTIERGQKVALIAPNGAGKTTLFNVITKALPLQHGSLEFGYNVKYAIFAQDQNKELNPKESILFNIQQRCPKVTEQAIRSMLGAFLFSGDDVQKKVGVLSGGEKNRVGMICVLLAQANFLMLDEPTNHLDIPSKEVLLKSLKAFPGTVFFVSHDRDFINKLATHIIELTPTGAHYYHGNYDAYLYHSQAIARANAPSAQHNSSASRAPQQAENDTKLTAFEINKKIKRTESTIEKLEERILQTQEQFADLDYGTPAFEQAQQQLQKLQADLKQTQLVWEDLQRQVYEE